MNLILLLLIGTAFAHDADTSIKIKHDMEFGFEVINATHFAFTAEVP